ncbi:MAG: sirohydrochlorin chelatase [Verrucomicrobiales bacterium]
MATALSDRVGHRVHPVSLLHSTRIDPAKLAGEPARIFEPFLKARRKQHGTNSFLVVPLFFGSSAAIREYLPQRVRALRRSWPQLELRIAPCLVDPDDAGDTGVAEILAQLVREKIAAARLDRPAVVLVDHGTPRQAVNRVRDFLADQLRAQLGDDAALVKAASMERREGDEYAFNEPLLESLLGGEGFDRNVVVSLMFLSPGRHAEPEGDIARICKQAERNYPGLRSHLSDLFTTHPGAVDLLARRFSQGLAADPIGEESNPDGVTLYAG